MMEAQELAQSLCTDGFLFGKVMFKTEQKKERAASGWKRCGRFYCLKLSLGHSARGNNKQMSESTIT